MQGLHISRKPTSTPNQSCAAGDCDALIGPQATQIAGGFLEVFRVQIRDNERGQDFAWPGGPRGNPARNHQAATDLLNLNLLRKGELKMLPRE